jgi:hypothetical protein
VTPPLSTRHGGWQGHHEPTGHTPRRCARGGQDGDAMDRRASCMQRQRPRRAPMRHAPSTGRRRAPTTRRAECSGSSLPARPGRGRRRGGAERAGRAASATRPRGPRAGRAPAGCGTGGATSWARRSPSRDIPEKSCFQESLVEWSTSFLMWHPLRFCVPTIVNRKVPRRGDPRAEAHLSQAPQTYGRAFP